MALRHFRLRCDGELDGSHGPALLVARYERRQITFRANCRVYSSSQIGFRLGHITSKCEHGALGEPCCFRSEALATVGIEESLRRV